MAAVPPTVKPPSALVLPLPLIAPPVQVVAPVTVSVPLPATVPPLITRLGTEEAALRVSVPVLRLSVPAASVRPPLTVTAAPVTARVPLPPTIADATLSAPPLKANVAPADAVKFGEAVPVIDPPPLSAKVPDWRRQCPRRSG